MTYPQTTYPNTPLHIDIPVKLDDVKAVFSVAALSLEGDLPASLFHLGLITNDIADWGATSEVVVVFHTNAGHVTLDHAAYNADRGIETGNPYKRLVTDLTSRGVHVELCGASAKVHHYGNADLIPGIAVNTDACFFRAAIHPSSNRDPCRWPARCRRFASDTDSPGKIGRRQLDQQRNRYGDRRHPPTGGSQLRSRRCAHEACRCGPVFHG